MNYLDLVKLPFGALAFSLDDDNEWDEDESYDEEEYEEEEGDEDEEEYDW